MPATTLRFTGLFRLLLVASLLLGCRVWSPAPLVPPAGPVGGGITDIELDPVPTEVMELALADLPAPPPVDLPAPQPDGQHPLPPDDIPAGEPAGCLSGDTQAGMATSQAMLAYADQLIQLDRPLGERVTLGAWNAFTRQYDYDHNTALTLDVADVKNEYLLQRMLSVLHVAGFVAWLRASDRPEQNLHILAIPLLDPSVLQGPWAGYIQPYWQDPQALPAGDGLVFYTPRLPPCDWMVQRGFAPKIETGWWPVEQTRWPDYATAAAGYLAGSTQEANQVARRIDWLGPQLESATTMCGPLSWSILSDAGAFPPGVGGWSAGPKTFWLARPDKNGRPWSLFPPETYRVYHYETPLAQFDFAAWPLYPGDFLYTYSEKDGFDHMLVVTEVDPAGNVYTVTNLVQVVPEEKTTIERALLVNLYDPSSGLVNNQWNDRRNGRTGHNGFDVFRWMWMEKDIRNEAVEYTVLPGDTFGSIAVKWKTPACWIAEYNGMEVDAHLAVGQALRIPPNQENERFAR